ncbi:putative glycerol-3-phosphate transporter 1 [Phtheirospermum japonicum]|uniref:Putative glycerol-3-phosphate transporter 1 n=1 Tax=Phtheirospermum japonicum TaxID=374723 RepID=A0A830CFY1_9LAMI|nr:putative glycerol-3-phosphate transporter 1 [Phtheirospermum japonicum]
MGSIEKPPLQKPDTKPPGIRLIEHIKGSPISYKTNQAIVLAVTFFAYLTYHTTRKTTSIVKTALDPQSPSVGSNLFRPGWTPFNGPDGTELLADLDVAFLFVEAWSIPGVAPFALCLFFAKLVAYTFLYWLPFYISHTAIEGRYLTDEESGNLSTMFDVGGVIGGILAGHISDHYEARATTAASFMFFAIPSLFLYRIYGHISTTLNISLMLITGMFVNGPYALITTAVSADLGTHSSLKGSSRALATVTAIIDGTGSIGVAIGPLLTGYISTRSWNGVFMMLMVSALIAGLLLTRLVITEVSEKIRGLRTHGLSSSGRI